MDTGTRGAGAAALKCWPTPPSCIAYKPLLAFSKGFKQLANMARKYRTRSAHLRKQIVKSAARQSTDVETVLLYTGEFVTPRALPVALCVCLPSGFAWHAGQRTPAAPRAC